MLDENKAVARHWKLIPVASGSQNDSLNERVSYAVGVDMRRDYPLGVLRSAA